MLMDEQMYASDLQPHGYKAGVLFCQNPGGRVYPAFFVLVGVRKLHYFFTGTVAGLGAGGFLK